ncbi:MAG: proline iminopeptidase-family hydrolase [Bacteroidales bacterium]|nr:proline iminopeptidase-family hydrolase [Bacteroidales bacterium]MCF8397149.1 proline iminopeptidase-family hydrolase [Bacteroidales bacterium]
MLKSLFITFMIAVVMIACKDKDDQPPGPTDKEGFIEVTGGRVWYKISGAGKTGIPLLVLHGGPGVPHDYLLSLEALTNERPVIFYDQLGCGNSDQPNDTTLWTVDRFVDELVAVRNELNIPQMHLLGQSWGTMLALEYLHGELPDGIVSLTLAAPYLNTQKWVADQQSLVLQLPQSIQDTIAKYEALGEYTADGYQEAMMIFYSKHVCRLDPWPEDLLTAMEKIGYGVYGYMWGPSEFTMTGTLKNADVTEYLTDLDMPVLYTCGEYDEATPATTEYYKNLTPGAEMHVFENASHEHHLESQKAFNQVLRDFLNRAEVAK